MHLTKNRSGKLVVEKIAIFTLSAVLAFVEINSFTSAQTWNRKRNDDLRDVVGIVKPRRGRGCENHRIRADGIVYDGLKGSSGSYLIVDQVVLVTGRTETNYLGYKNWQVVYEPSQTVMWLNDCDLSIPKIAN